MKAHITFEVEVSDIAGLMSRLGLSSDAPVQATIEGVSDTAAPRPRRARSTTTEAIDAAPAQEVPDAPRRRRGAPASETDAAPASAMASDTRSEAEQPSRRRRAASTENAAAIVPPSISDLDLAKGASEAAEALTKLGDKGQEIVQDVLREDFGCAMVNEIPADKRQAFLDAIQEQVDLAKADAAKVAT